MEDIQYDDTLAALYDDSPLLSVDADHPSVECFCRIAEKYGGPVLHIGVATGRFALPIARAGHEVVGVDVSESMLAALRQRIAGEPPEVRDRLTAVRGDMRTLRLDRKFPLIILPGNVFLYNLTQRDQLATLATMRRHLADGGMLAIDVFTMERALLGATGPTSSSHRFRTSAGEEYLAEQTTLVDPLSQLEVFRVVHRRIGEDCVLGPAMYSELTMRYVQPAEMLLLLAVAGLRPHEFRGDYSSDAPKTTYAGRQLVLAGRADAR